MTSLDDVTATSRNASCHPESILMHAPDDYLSDVGSHDPVSYVVLELSVLPFCKKLVVVPSRAVVPWCRSATPESGFFGRATVAKVKDLGT